MSRPDSTSRFAGIALRDRVRQEGPFELWNADLQGRGLLVRRVSKDLANAASIRRALAAASQVAQRVAHENVVLCHGMAVIDGEEVQISERPVQIELRALMRERFDVRTATWIARQLAEAIVHAESLALSHGNITPAYVFAGVDGSIRIDFGIARADGSVDQTAIAGVGDAAYQLRDARGRPDLFAIARIWSELIGGEPPASIAPAIARAPASDAKSFASALARIFYVELDADDEKNGAQVIVDRVSSALGVAPPSKVELAALTNPEAAPPRGTFTRMLEERARPVEPKPLSMDDLDAPSAENPMTVPTIRFPSAPMPSISSQAPLAPRSTWSIWVKWFLLGFVLTLLGLRIFR